MCCKNHSQFPSLPTSLEKLTAVQAAVVQYIAQAMHSHTHTLTRLELQYASSQHLPCTFWSYSWVHLKVFFCVLRPYSYHFPTAHLDLDWGGSPDFLHVSHLLLIWDGKKFFPNRREIIFSASPDSAPGLLLVWHARNASPTKCRVQEASCSDAWAT